jgi:tetratricopeptide (TPR) repeat protein
VLGLALCLGLAACQSSEERAAAFFESGLELRAAGDLDRAVVEFRNVFRYDGDHREARLNLAEILVERGRRDRAFSQYLRLAEQYPEDLGVRATLAVLAMEAGDWAAAERHGSRVVEADPGTVDARVIAMGLAFRAAAMEGDAATRAALAEDARILLEEAPENVSLWQIVVSETSQSAPETALEGLDALLALRPDDLQYWASKLQLLTNQGRTEEARALLEGMQTAFPDSPEATRMMVGWYLFQGEDDAAIAALRRDAGEDTSNPRDHAPVIALIRQLGGREAALEEIARLIEANAEDPNNLAHYRGLRATERLRAGEHEAAIAELREVVGTTDLPGRLLWIKASLADALRAQGEPDEALVLVEEILADDATNVDALKVRGAILVARDRPDEAIVDLRRALDQDPRDSDILVLLAEAHQRAGDPELMGERLAAAVEVSEAGVPETLRYAAFLLSQGREAAVRTLLAESRARNPRDVGLLAQVGRFGLQQRDLGTVESVVADLSEIGTPDAEAVVRALRTGLLLMRSGNEEGIAFLMRQAGDLGQNSRAVLAVVNAWVQSGRPDQARAYLDELRERAPESLDLSLMDGALALVEGDGDRSEAVMRRIVADAPESAQAVEATRLLFGQLRVQGRDAEIAPLIEVMLEAQPGSRMIRLLHATYLEYHHDDIEAAIAIYEELYDENTGDILVANNLASLIGAHRMGDAALERAARISQRLRGSDIPAFQDTYGWIAHRQGRYEEALTYLEPAAEGLATDPLVQYHLGMTYLALERTDRARVQLERAVRLGADRALPQMQIARETLAGMDALEAAPPTDVDETSASGAPATGGTPPAAAQTLPTGNRPGE